MSPASAVIQRIRLALALLAGFAVGGGCTFETPDPSQLVIRSRVFEPTENTEGFGWRMGDLDGEMRPVINLPRRVFLNRLRSEEPSSNGIVRTYSVSETLDGRLVAITREMLAPAADSWQKLSPLLARVEGDRVRVAFEAPAGSSLRAEGFAVPEAPLERVSARFRIPERGRLDGTVGLSGVIPRVRQGRVRIRLSALFDGAERVLFERVFQSDADLGKWIDYRIELGDLVGKFVRLKASAEVLTGSQPGGDLALPLVGNPILSGAALDTRPSFLVVSLDTLRADHVGVYGAREPTTPNFDRYAGSAVTFLDASTTYPSTTAAHMSLFTGLYPGTHRVFAPPRALAKGVATLPDLLARSGYRTGAITENGMLVARAGFARGFDSYTELREPNRAGFGGVEAVVDRGIAWLDRYSGERFFLFLHTYEVHGPHEPSKEFDRFRTGQENSLESTRQAYAGEVLFTDHHLSRLFARLEGLENTVVLITSDHGEAFGEHGQIVHGHTLIEEVVRIPFVFRAPGTTIDGLNVKVPVSLVDVLPTILELAKIELPANVHGQSLVALASGQQDAKVSERPIYLHQQLRGGKGFRLGVRRGTEKWLIGHEDEDVIVYDLSSDPGELTPRRADSDRALGHSLRRQYEEASGKTSSPAGKRAQGTRLDGATRERLRALGYVDVADSPPID